MALITDWHRTTAAGFAAATAPKGGTLPAVFQKALATVAPRDSSIFDTVREPEEEQPMRAFVVCVRRRIDGAVVRHFEAMGRHAVDVTAQHLDLAGPGERVHVMTAEAYALERKIAAEADRTQRAELNRLPLGGFLA